MLITYFNQPKRLNNPDYEVEIIMSKYLVVPTHFDDNIEKAVLPWVVANIALAEG